MEPREVQLCAPAVRGPDASLFERTHWLYAIFRQYIFRDQTDIIARELWSDDPPADTHLLELGCGPGFYSCRLAKRFPQIRTTGVDLSPKLIDWAKNRARQQSLTNTHFLLDDAQHLMGKHGRVDAVVLSRLFLIVPDKEAVVSEAHGVLHPGGRCFIAEPVASARTRLPLQMLWALARLSVGPVHHYPEPLHQDGMKPEAFKALIHTQPWANVRFGRDRWYQYAVCTRADEAVVETAAATSPTEAAR